MTHNLYDAHRQWCTRPPDERFADLDSLLAYTSRLKASSQERVTELVDLHIDVTDRLGLALNGTEEPALLTNWSFNQLCTAIGAPAKYLRSLPPRVVIECMRWGLGEKDVGAKLLYRNGGGDKTVAAFTGPNYGRIWDADVVAALQDAVAGTGWHVPSARTNGLSENAGLYASDRDMFAFFVNDENPIEVGNARLGRGFFCWNSETGSCTFGLTTFLYNYVCGNHIVWGAEEVRELKIVHRSKALDRFRTEALPALNRFVENRLAADTIADTIRRVSQVRVGDEFEQVAEWFKDRPFTGPEVSAAWHAGRDEDEDVSNLWGMVQGFTAHARNLDFANHRVDLERRAGQLLVPAH